MFSEELSGGKLFLRYAWPCAETRKLQGQITVDDFEALQVLIDSDGEPETSLLERCFPLAFSSLKKLAEGLGAGDRIWTREIVAEYWHCHHGHNGDCEVRLAVFDRVLRDQVVVVDCRGEKIRVVNAYNLILKSSDECYIHRSVVIEKSDLSKD